MAQNVLEHGTGAININGCRVGTDVVGWEVVLDLPTLPRQRQRLKQGWRGTPFAGRWPANLIHDGSDAEQAAAQ